MKTLKIFTLLIYDSLNIFLMFIFERDREWAGEGQRERETQNPKQTPDSELLAPSPTWGSNLQTMRS